MRHAPQAATLVYRAHCSDGSRSRVPAHKESGRLIIPVTVFAVVFLLYKFPPSRFRVSKPSARSAAPDRLKTKSRSRKTVPFRVIEGGKDDDNQPKYH